MDSATRLLSVTAPTKKPSMGTPELEAHFVLIGPSSGQDPAAAYKNAFTT